MNQEERKEEIRKTAQRLIAKGLPEAEALECADILNARPRE